jgi:tetratricopeptide (TPR) repeat protein/tRNA A-37 threonylcarbamoyl transferase component Bud32
VHRGGQGVVYEAVQRSTRRRVAIKVTREGPFAGVADRARFDREVQILAQLRHSNIVAIHDSGHFAGHDYFVMDFIEGRPLDRYVSETAGRSGAATIRAVAQLFVKVCEGVSAAHLRGVIHRDLKPGNVLVDAGGEPHILDFGLAKHVEHDAAPAANMTVTGQFVGSLPWSSPEQAGVDPVDVRTDVYAIGVMLYEALTGRFPYRTSGPPAQVLEAIREHEPVRPRAIRRDIDDELETIVLRCLAKDRHRRYQSAGELGRDLTHYLRGEPIDAKRDSTLYMLRKTLWRYRLAGSVVVGLVLLITAFAAITALQAARVRRERDRAEHQHLRADRVQRFLQSMFAAASPDATPASDVSVRVLLDDGARRLEAEFAEWPEEAAAIHETLGNTYDDLGHFAEGEYHLRRSLDLRREVLGEAHPLTAQALGQLALSVFNRQDLDRAEALLREAIELGGRVLGGEHADVLELSTELAALLVQIQRLDEAETIARDSLAAYRRMPGPEHPRTGICLWIMGRCALRRGEYDRALALLTEAAAIVKRTAGVGQGAEACTMALADVHERLGHIDAAESLYREVIDARRKRLGDEHPALAWNLSCLARLLLQRRLDPAAAEPLVRQALAIQQSRKGPDHIDTADVQTLLAEILTAQGAHSQAEPLLRESLRIRQRPGVGQEAHASEASAKLADCLEAQSRFDEAREARAAAGNP